MFEMWYLTASPLMLSREAISAFVPPSRSSLQDAPLGRRQDIGVARAAAGIALHWRHRRGVSRPIFPTRSPCVAHDYSQRANHSTTRS